MNRPNTLKSVLQNLVVLTNWIVLHLPPYIVYTLSLQLQYMTLFPPPRIAYILLYKELSRHRKKMNGRHTGQ